jgi:ornithine cyclodeaminase
MRIVSLDQIKERVSEQMAIGTVRDAYIACANGEIGQPEPLQILFQKDDRSFIGDCHVKAAQKRGNPYFAIKVATGFYKNRERGLPVNNGLVLVMSAESGYPVALLQDEGWLTQIRTAAAGAISAALVPHNDKTRLGIIGTGEQAYLQAKLIGKHLGPTKITVLGTSFEKSEAFANRLRDDYGLDSYPASNPRELCTASDIVVTTTPSLKPIIAAKDVSDKLHIIAVGADSPGKSEIASDVLAKADIIVTDSHIQCLHHGDFGNAVKSGAIAEDDDISLCDPLAGKAKADFANAKISVVDLTGLGVQDLAMAGLVVDGFNEK